MGYFPENEIFTVKEHIRNDTYFVNTPIRSEVLYRVSQKYQTGIFAKPCTLHERLRTHKVFTKRPVFLR